MLSVVLTVLFLFVSRAVEPRVHPDLSPLLQSAESVEVKTDGSSASSKSDSGVRSDDDIDEEGPDLQCGLVRDLTSGRRSETECCRVGSLEKENSGAGASFEVKCLPSFIVAGTQKSGTTVLSALLASHPQVSFARKKELHYFSNDKYYKRGLVKGYLDYFRKWNYTEEAWRDRPPLYGEATPYYLASRKACPRMAQTVGTDLKLIVLLREPVARAYSEYQMKIRRVQQQDEFVSLCEEHSAALYECLSDEEEVAEAISYRNGHPKIQWKAVKRCFPPVVKEHFHWSKFVSAVDEHCGAVESWTEVLQRCFTVVHSDPVTSRKGSVSFEAKGCLKKHAREQVRSVEDAFFGEIQSFHDCVRNESALPVPDSAFYKYGVQSPAELDRQVGRCLHVKSGISSQYVYRSLYVVQLFHCLKYFHREQLLVLPSERLKADPMGVYEQTLRFIGVDVDKEGVGGGGGLAREGEGREKPEDGHLPSSSFSSSDSDSGSGSGSDQDITAAVKANFPVFERNTGWRLYGQYDALDTASRQRLLSYFSPFNEMLFDYLGERFDEWAQQ